MGPTPPLALSALGLAIFFCLLLLTVARAPSMFAGRFGRRHRLAGLLLLLWLALGAVLLIRAPQLPTAACLGYDIVLGVLGTAATFTAAADFRAAHARVCNPGSGTLDAAATVTHSEMAEHGFYQLLNLAQILTLHALGSPAAADRLWLRAALLLLGTAPWLARGRFPVNQFSSNYTRGQDAHSLLAWLYFVKVSLGRPLAGPARRSRPSPA